MAKTLTNIDDRGRFIKGHIPWHKGKKGLVVAWNKGIPMAEEMKKRISVTKTGVKRGWGYWTGKKMSDEHKRKLSESHKREKSYLWIADRSKIKVEDRFLNDPLQKQWRRDVKNRDKWKCMISDENCNGRLEAHHILPWSQYPELRYETKNGITLCHYHHPRKSEEVEKLAPVFQKMVYNFLAN